MSSRNVFPCRIITSINHEKIAHEPKRVSKAHQQCTTTQQNKVLKYRQGHHNKRRANTETTRRQLTTHIDTSRRTEIKHDISFFIVQQHDKHLQHTVNKIKEIMMSQMKANRGLEELIIIDALQRLGLAYYFKDEIKAILNSQFEKFNSCEKNASIDNLHEIALRFRLLRQEGYNISPDIFKKFKNNDGKFKKELSNNLRGLLSLFEATQWSIQDEDILDEASEFSEQVLKASLMEDIEQPKAEVILYTLQNPVHKSLPTRLLDKNFLFTEFLNDFTGSKNWMDEVMKLASLDFEMVQMSSGKELFQVSLWGKELNSAKKLQFARIRPIKWYMWSLAILPWPSMVEERIELAKAVSFIYVIDDIFDVHGTLDELTLFTEVINRWECNDIDHLPDYMKVCLKALYDFMEDFSYKIYKKYNWDPKYSLMKVWIDLCNSFLVEAKWLKLGQLPSAKEYLNNGIISVGVHLVLMHAFFLLGGVNRRSIDEMNHLPCIVSSAALIVRLWNDIGTDQNVNRIENDGSYIDCLKNENEEKWTAQNASTMISDAWKRLNQESLLSTSPFSTKFKAACLNFAKMGVIMYNHDVIAHRQSLEKLLSSLLHERGEEVLT